MSFGCSCQVKLTLRGSGLVTLEFLTVHCLPGLARPSTPTLDLDFEGEFDIGDLEVRISCVSLTDKPRELRQSYDVSFRLIECGCRVKIRPTALPKAGGSSTGCGRFSRCDSGLADTVRFSDIDCHSILSGLAMSFKP